MPIDDQITDPTDIEPDLDLSAIADGLSALRPAALTSARRDAILFQAGRASVLGSPPAPRRRTPWPAVAASLGAIALGEGALLAHRPPPRVVERVVVVREPAPALPPAPVPAAPPRPEPAPLVVGPYRVGSTDRFDLANRPALPVASEVVPRLPLPSGRDRRRREFQLALSPLGGPS